MSKWQVVIMIYSANKLTFIGEYIPEELNDYYRELGKSNFSGAIFNNTLLKGLREEYENVTILSCPNIGHYPIFSRCITTKTFHIDNDTLCLGYNNLIGLNNYSKKNKIFKEFSKRFKKNEHVDVIVSEASYFALLSYKKIKKHFKNVRGILLVFDLPENIIGSKKSFIYSTLKKVSYKKIRKMYNLFDSFVFLSEQMNDKVNFFNKPYKVFPCIVDLSSYDNIEQNHNSKFVVMYSGVVSKQYNIDLLLEAFSCIKSDDFVLRIVGGGDAVDDVKKAMLSDSRIEYLGVVSPTNALRLQYNSDCLINPRLPNKQYTSESFPSKTVNYLLTLKPVVSYNFSSIPREILNLLFIPNDYTPESMAETILKCKKSSYNSSNVYNVLEKYSYKSAGRLFKNLFNNVKNNN